MDSVTATSKVPFHYCIKLKLSTLIYTHLHTKVRNREREKKKKNYNFLPLSHKHKDKEELFFFQHFMNISKKLIAMNIFKKTTPKGKKKKLKTLLQCLSEFIFFFFWKFHLHLLNCEEWYYFLLIWQKDDAFNCSS